MEGVALDTHFLGQMSSELNERITEYEGKIFNEVGESFNLNSPQQLSAALFEKLDIKPPDRTQRTASGFYSTSANVLEALRGLAFSCFNIGLSDEEHRPRPAMDEWDAWRRLPLEPAK